MRAQRKLTAIVARELIRDQARDLRKRAAASMRTRLPDAFHEVRIRAKRLRYTLDAFASLYGDAAQDYIGALAKLQTVLGEYHDSNVREQRFTELVARGPRLPPSTSFLVGRLVERDAQMSEKFRTAVRKSLSAHSPAPLAGAQRRHEKRRAGRAATGTRHGRLMEVYPRQARHCARTQSSALARRFSAAADRRKAYENSARRRVASQPVCRNGRCAAHQPYVRARETAAMLGKVAKLPKPVECPELAASESAQRGFVLLRTRKERAVVLVGHEPWTEPVSRRGACGRGCAPRRSNSRKAARPALNSRRQSSRARRPCAGCFRRACCARCASRATARYGSRVTYEVLFGDT